MIKLPDNLDPDPKTWIIDIDGTIFKHMGYEEGHDTLLPGVKEFWDTQIGADDVVILVTARDKELQPLTRVSLAQFGLRYDVIVFGVGTGTRILINDVNPHYAVKAVAVEVVRDGGL